MDATAILQLVGGLVLLFLGGELLVRGASRMAVNFGVSPLVVGLTIVAICTSAPEGVVSVTAAAAGTGDLAVGNVVGSNICNVLLILGLSAAVAPLTVAVEVIRRDVPIMIAAALLVPVLGWDGTFAWIDGLLLLIGLAAYLGWTVRTSLRAPREEQEGVEKELDLPKRSRPLEWVLLPALVVGGLALLVIGADGFVAGATALARAFGVSDLVVGLTIVAAGTSLPELATSVIASFRGQREIAVGNAVGSNILNVLGVLGLSAVAAPEGVSVPDQVLAFDAPVMAGVCIACLPIFFSGGRISRGEGLLFLFFYVAYLAYLVLDSTQSEALPHFRMAMLFVIPLSAVTVLTIVVQAIRARRPGS